LYRSRKTHRTEELYYGPYNCLGLKGTASGNLVKAHIIVKINTDDQFLLSVKGQQVHNSNSEKSRDRLQWVYWNFLI